jgi:hypothetical protein
VSKNISEAWRCQRKYYGARRAVVSQELKKKSLAYASANSTARFALWFFKNVLKAWLCQCYAHGALRVVVFQERF